MLRIFLFRTFSGIIVEKFAREVLKRAFQKCGSGSPIVLLAEIDENLIFKLIFIRVFLDIIVEIGEKYALTHFSTNFNGEKSKIEKVR